MKRKSLRVLAITLAAVQMLMLVPTAKVSASTESLAEGDEFADEELVDEEVADEEVVDEELVDEEVADEELVDEEIIDEEVTDEEPADEEPNEEPVEEEELEVEDNAEITYLLKVIDQYLDEEGIEENSEIRYEESVPEGEEYSFSALDVEYYDLVSDAEFSGVVTEDTTLIFTYAKAVDAKIDTYAVGDTHTVTFYNSTDFFGEPCVDRNSIYQTIEVADGEKITMPDTNPTLTGYIFDGWKAFEITHDGITTSVNSYSFDVYNDPVTGDISVAAVYISEDKEMTLNFFTKLDLNGRKIFYYTDIPLKDCNIVTVGGKNFIKAEEPQNISEAYKLAEDEGYTIIGWSAMGESTVYYYRCDLGSDTFTRTTDFTDFNDNIYLSLGNYAYVYPIRQKTNCLVTINDAYYQADGTTLIKTDLRSTETVAGGTEYSYSALKPNDYELIGYSTGTSSSVNNNDTVSGTLSDDLVITFKYKKIGSTPAPDPQPEPQPTPDPESTPDPQPTSAPALEESGTPEVQLEESVAVEVKTVEKSAEIAPFVEEPKTGDVGGFNMQLLLAFSAFDILLAAVYLLWGKKFVD